MKILRDRRSFDIHKRSPLLPSSWKVGLSASSPKFPKTPFYWNVGNHWLADRTKPVHKPASLLNFRLWRTDELFG